MTRDKFLFGSISIVLFGWVIGRILYAEIYQWYCVLFSLFMIIYVCIESITKRKPKHIFFVVFYIIFIVYAIWALDKVSEQAKEYAMMFHEEYQCRPNAEKLLKTSSGWRWMHKNPHNIAKGITSWGAVREIVYRDDLGTLHYGLPIPDGKPVLRLPNCTK
jgi:hypothetical protein